MIFKHDKHEETKLGGQYPYDDLDKRNVAEQTRVADMDPKPLGPLPVPRHLLKELRRYPRMRDLVFGYLTVQERLARYEEILTDLDAAGEKPDRPFWARLSGRLDRLEFPTSLLGDAEFESLVAKFESERGNAAQAAMYGRSPHQSAQSAEAVYHSVTEIVRSAEELAALCRAEARDLLNRLGDALNKIFPDDEEPREPAAAEDRMTKPRLDEPQDLQEPGERPIDTGLSEPWDADSASSREKELPTSATADFQPHLLAKRGVT
jgi:hypothetical protein